MAIYEHKPVGSCGLQMTVLKVGNTSKKWRHISLNIIMHREVVNIGI